MHRLSRAALLMAAALLVLASCGRKPDLSSAVLVDAEPRIDPDYASVVIPPNIAPLNFRVLEDGRDCVVRISSDAGPAIEIHCPDRAVRIGPKAWREMLSSNRGKCIYYDIWLRRAGGEWAQFRRITQTVAEEPIDPYLVYRQVDPNTHFANIKGIFQRNLETFESTAIVTQRHGTFECFNCHTFCQNDPSRFLFHLRGKDGGMMLVADGRIRKINTQSPPMWRPLAYASWHPDGIHIAATVNQVYGRQMSSEKVSHFEAVEKRGDLVVYNIETNCISTARPVFENNYVEAHPCWSSDGKYIYYIRCHNHPLRDSGDFDAFRFDLARVSCNVAADAWGEPEIIFECSKLGKSCSFPCASPDGRYILCVLSDKTNYPIHQTSSDLWVYDLQSKQPRRLDAANSDLAESYPRWSSNGRWFSFVSTRRDGLHTLPYLAYFDAQGRDRKPIVLPQEDPGYYDDFTDAYNIVELVKSKVTVDPFKLAEAMQQQPEPALFPHPPNVDAYTGATRAAP